MNVRLSLRAVLVASIFASTLASTSRADDANDGKKACADAYTQAQTLRDAHRLKEARAQLRTCAQTSCAAFIVKDCTEWLAAVERVMPSVVLVAKDARGSSLSKVAVSADGTPLTGMLDGGAIEIDPGSHTFVFVAEDGARAEVPYTVMEGQKAQAVAVTFPALPAPPTPPLPSVEPPPDRSVASRTSFWTVQRTLGVVTAGVGVAGVAVGSVFGVLMLSAANAQKNHCASPTSCTAYGTASTDHSTAVKDGNAATAAFIAGGALIAGGAILFLTSPSDKAQVGLTVAPGNRGGAMLLHATF
nr:hypothetical protein Hi04_10k_c2441B_00028 [uncultured bacterium]